MLPPLLAKLCRDAPRIDLTIVPFGGGGLASRLEAGELDIAIVPRVEDGATLVEAVTSELCRRTLFHDRSCACFAQVILHCDARNGAPRPRSHSISTRRFLVLLAPSGGGGGLVDDALAKRRRERRIALRVPHFLSTLEIVQKSDLVLTAPSSLVRLARSPRGVVALAPPLAMPRHAVDVVWHERLSADAGHRWLRETVAEIARAGVDGVSA